MKTCSCIIAVVQLVLLSHFAAASPPAVLNHQGRISVSNLPRSALRDSLFLGQGVADLGLVEGSAAVAAKLVSSPPPLFPSLGTSPTRPTGAEVRKAVPKQQSSIRLIHPAFCAFRSHGKRFVTSKVARVVRDDDVAGSLPRRRAAFKRGAKPQSRKINPVTPTSFSQNGDRMRLLGPEARRAGTMKGGAFLQRLTQAERREDSTDGWEKEA